MRVQQAEDVLHVQVAEWVARILAAGDAFAGPGASGSLRALLAVQASSTLCTHVPCQNLHIHREQWQGYLVQLQP